MSAVATATIGSLLLESGLPRAEAQLLVRILLGCERAWLIAHAEETVEPSRRLAAQDWFSRRRAGEPIAYITGEREFFGLALRVTPEVLIPRPETELLVELALGRIPPGGAVLDLGTGSGAVALALAHGRPGLQVTATEVSESALAIARENARRHELAIDFVPGDWFEALGPGLFDLIVSNPPYVASHDPHLEQGDLRFEPRLALAGGEGGMQCIRHIAAGARARIRPGGWLLFEHGCDQSARCMALLGGLGYVEVEDFRDLAGLPRVCAGRCPG